MAVFRFKICSLQGEWDYFSLKKKRFKFIKNSSHGIISVPTPSEKEKMYVPLFSKKIAHYL